MNEEIRGKKLKRPSSIIWFERFYLGAVAMGVFSTAVNWSELQSLTSRIPNANILPGWYMIANLVFAWICNILLWYFIARRGSIVAKFILTIFFAFSLISVPISIFGMGPVEVSMRRAVMGLLAIALQGAAVWMLFRSDTKPWFGIDDRHVDKKES